MKYRYRWWCVCALVTAMLAAGFVFDVQEILHERAVLLQMQRDQQNKTSANRSIVISEPSRQSVSSWQSFAEFNNLCARHHLVIGSAEGLDDDAQQLVVRGDYADVKALLVEFFSSDHEYAINLHSLSAEADGTVTAELRLNAGEDYTASSLQHSLLINANPFCGGNRMQMSMMQAPIAALTEIRLLGVLRLGTEKYALFQLPDNHVVQAVIGERIGKEYAVIESMQANTVTLVYPNHQKKILRY